MQEEVNFFFDGWLPILRILLIGTFGYIFLLITLRLSGPRTLARTNIFDFIISVGVGSAFGRVLTAKEVALLEVMTVFVLLAGLQILFSNLRRHGHLAAWIDADPALVFYNGRYIREAMRKSRITQSDIEEFVRSNGLCSMDSVEAVVLESGGEFSVIKKSLDEKSLLAPLLRYKENFVEKNH